MRTPKSRHYSLDTRCFRFGAPYIYSFNRFWMKLMCPKSFKRSDHAAEYEQDSNYHRGILFLINLRIFFFVEVVYIYIYLGLKARSYTTSSRVSWKMSSGSLLGGWEQDRALLSVGRSSSNYLPIRHLTKKRGTATPTELSHLRLTLKALQSFTLI